MNRPYIIINCAASVDGKIALSTKKQFRISSDEDIKRMYKLRNECDAVLVGINTILSDDPKLTVKEKYVKNPKQPFRIILDSKCRIPDGALVLNTVSKTLIITLKGNERCIEGRHIEVIGCNANAMGQIDLKCAMELLYKKGVRKLLVEGGGIIIWNFLHKKIVDDLFIYIGPYIVGGKKTPTIADGLGIQDEGEIINLKIIEIKRLGSGILTHYRLV
jgi:2,5-diamino-6-(ribosylamino)-4(3H)-pyrimidinone 5'-phosphate reductase